MTTNITSAVFGALLILISLAQVLLPEPQDEKVTTYEVTE